MKIGSKLQYDVPDKCPSDCAFKPEYLDQGSVCVHCPVLCCMPTDMGPMVDPDGVRDDWAEEWQEFFTSGKHPVLKLNRRKSKETEG